MAVSNDAFPKTVYEMFVDKGLVTGGEYNSKKGCMPYQSFTQAATDATNSSTCPHECTNKAYRKTYKQDKLYGNTLDEKKD